MFGPKRGVGRKARWHGDSDSNRFEMKRETSALTLLHLAIAQLTVRVDALLLGSTHGTPPSNLHVSRAPAPPRCIPLLLLELFRLKPSPTSPSQYSSSLLSTAPRACSALVAGQRTRSRLELGGSRSIGVEKVRALHSPRSCLNCQHKSLRTAGTHHRACRPEQQSKASFCRRVVSGRGREVLSEYVEHPSWDSVPSGIAPARAFCSAPSEWERGQTTRPSATGRR